MLESKSMKWLRMINKDTLKIDITKQNQDHSVDSTALLYKAMKEQEKKWWSDE